MTEISLISWFVSLGMRSEGNAPKNGEPTVGVSFTQCSSTPVVFSHGFLGKEHCDNTRTYLLISSPGSG